MNKLKFRVECPKCRWEAWTECELYDFVKCELCDLEFVILPSYVVSVKKNRSLKPQIVLENVPDSKSILFV